MKKIEAIIQPFRLDDVMNALWEIGVEGMTVTEVKGHGRQSGHPVVYRGQEYQADLLHKTKVEVVVGDSDCDAAITAISKAARTGHAGDGKIFVIDMPEVIRIRNLQRNEAAL
ncbi:MAG TPA: P-II family nitrogen regulator [Bryobacteraceae bacterium]|jgi:nitrogen regulatory protein P-II 1|nr:P-II family nitrogen regulator [Bryobacteraceae bacterium]